MGRSFIRYKSRHGVETLNQKRRDGVEAIVNRKALVHAVAGIFNVRRRTICDWLARVRGKAGTELAIRSAGVVLGI